MKSDSVRDEQVDSGLPWSGEPGPLRRFFKDPRILFLLVGGANTAFSTALFTVLVIFFGPRVPSAVSLVIAWIVSLVLVFFVYRKLVFRVEGRVFRDLMRFAGVNLASFLINVVALTLLVEVAGLPPIPTQLAITFVVVLFNYIGHKYFSFRR